MAILVVEFSTAFYYYSRLSSQHFFLDTLSQRDQVPLDTFSEKRATLNRKYFLLFVNSAASLLTIEGLKQKCVKVGAGKIYCFTSPCYRKQHMWSSMCTKPVKSQTLFLVQKVHCDECGENECATVSSLCFMFLRDKFYIT